MERTLVIGIGSILRSDDAVGIRVIEELEKETFPEHISLRSADISGLDFLKCIYGYEKAVIIDAADMKERPATVRIFKAADMGKGGFKDTVSTHGMGLVDTLKLAEELDISTKMIIVGVQPKNISFGLELSEEIKKIIPRVVLEVKKILSK